MAVFTFLTKVKWTYLFPDTRCILTEKKKCPFHRGMHVAQQYIIYAWVTGTNRALLQKQLQRSCFYSHIVSSVTIIDTTLLFVKAFICGKLSVTLIYCFEIHCDLRSTVLYETPVLFIAYCPWIICDHVGLVIMFVWHTLSYFKYHRTSLRWW